VRVPDIVGEPRRTFLSGIEKTPTKSKRAHAAPVSSTAAGLRQPEGF
jgi:hypothetical protein